MRLYTLHTHARAYTYGHTFGARLLTYYTLCKKIDVLFLVLNSWLLHSQCPSTMYDYYALRNLPWIRIVCKCDRIMCVFTVFYLLPSSKSPRLSFWKSLFQRNSFECVKSERFFVLYSLVFGHALVSWCEFFLRNKLSFFFFFPPWLSLWETHSPIFFSCPNSGTLSPGIADVHSWSYKSKWTSLVWSGVDNNTITTTTTHQF